LEVLRLHIAGFSEVEEVVSLEPGIVPPMDVGTWGSGRLGLLLFSLYKQGFPSFRKATHTLTSSSSSNPPFTIFFLLHFPLFNYSLLIILLL